MEENEKNESLEKIKNIIRIKEEKISKSQTRVNNLENNKNKLEKQKRSIKKGWRSIVSNILFYINYSLIILLILAAYIIPFIDILKTVKAFEKTVCTLSLYIGVISISVLGAYAASKVELLLKNRKIKKCSEISNKIESKEQEINKEKELQETLKKEITTTLNTLDIKEKEILLPEEKYYNKQEEYIDESYLEYINEKPYTRRKKRN